MKKIVSINPTNDDIVGAVSASTEQEIADKVKRARKAASLWKSLGIEKRIAILQPLLALFKNHEHDIAKLITLETGKPITESLSDIASEFTYLNDFLKNGSHYIADEMVYQQQGETHKIIYEPMGVVACIVPWNYPFSNFTWSVIPNLIVGNVVILKHSEECPLTAQLIEKIMLSLPGFPPDVFSMIYGDGEEGKYLAKQPIDMIWFTGSSATGRCLSAIAGEKQIKAILEMGGSSPAIVFNDGYNEGLIENIYNRRFSNCGQVCDAVKRLIVHRDLFDKVVTGLQQHIKEIRIGDPLDPETKLGPLVSHKQLVQLEAQISEAWNHGAKVWTIGNKPKNGAFCLPTLLTGVTPTMKVWQEEVFGPVLPVMPFDTKEEAITLANDNPYGLSAVIYTRDINKARHVAGQIDAGCIDINDGNHWQPGTPFGGYKASGMGREHGQHGFRDLCQVKVIAEA